MLLNDELNLSCPDVFHMLDSAERSRLDFIAPGEGICLSAPDQHILISVGWQKLGPFASFVLGTSDAADRMKISIRKAMAPFNYRAEEPLQVSLGGEKAKGIRYLYDAREIEMTGESCVVRYRKNLYYFHYYTRAVLREENQIFRNRILESVRWS